MNRTEYVVGFAILMIFVIVFATIKTLLDRTAGYYTNETKIKRATLDKQTCPCVKGKQ